MKIYTRTGDGGQTSLFGGQRRSKADQRVISYGTVDELQAALGVAMAEIPEGALVGKKTITALQAVLSEVQHDCFVISCELARTETNPKRKDPVLSKERVGWLETQIDTYDAELPPLTAFILQGGSRLGASLHLARAICRRAEREVVVLQETEAVAPLTIQYLNRLSDLLFVLARFSNHRTGNIEQTFKDR